ncbi:hypothetical protein GCM10010517_65440 [Streptosporangium fragile]|uniref:Uncharacterized protein n=1 Tax=Streptosporangium fragile TaxID=46186 RepID=A0ABN3W6S1_9ACTN
MSALSGASRSETAEQCQSVEVSREPGASGVVVTLVVHEHRRLGRGIEFAAPAEPFQAVDIGREFLTGELQGSRGPSGIVFTVLVALSEVEREYIHDRAPEGHESGRGTAIGGADDRD